MLCSVAQLFAMENCIVSIVVLRLYPFRSAVRGAGAGLAGGCGPKRRAVVVVSRAATFRVCGQPPAVSCSAIKCVSTDYALALYPELLLYLHRRRPAQLPHSGVTPYPPPNRALTSRRCSRLRPRRRRRSHPLLPPPPLFEAPSRGSDGDGPPLAACQSAIRSRGSCASRTLATLVGDSMNPTPCRLAVVCEPAALIACR